MENGRQAQHANSRRLRCVQTSPHLASGHCTLSDIITSGDCDHRRYRIGPWRAPQRVFWLCTCTTAHQLCRHTCAATVHDSTMLGHLAPAAAAGAWSASSARSRGERLCTYAERAYRSLVNAAHPDNIVLLSVGRAVLRPACLFFGALIVCALVSPLDTSLLLMQHVTYARCCLFVAVSEGLHWARRQLRRNRRYARAWQTMTRMYTRVSYDPPGVAGRGQAFARPMHRCTSYRLRSGWRDR